MKKLILILMLSLTLTACGPTAATISKIDNENIIGEVKDAKIINKSKKLGNKLEVTMYFITIDKDGQKLKLQLKTEETYNAINKDLIVSAKYNEYYVIQEMNLKAFKKGGK